MITEEQKAKLAQDLPRDVIKTRRSPDGELSYIEGWYTIDRANQIFGFDGWSSELLDTKLLAREIVEKKNRETGEVYRNVVIVVQTTVQVAALGVLRQDVGVGLGEARENNFASAFELAVKASATDALKRVLRTFGHQFGLALYDKEREHVGASTTAHDLLASLQNTTQLEDWFAANQAEIVKLHNADKQLVVDAFNARRAEAQRAEYEAQIARATKVAELQAVLEAAANANASQAEIDRLAKRCSERKAQLVAGQNGNGNVAARS